MLVDHEELILQIRDPNSRAYFREAVRSYGAGAYRAAVLSTWVAVTYDLIEKFRELAMANDAAATKIVTDLDRWIASNAVGQMQEFETRILKEAHAQFQFFTARELIDLERLYKDRNHCAHPSFASSTEIYSPSAELVRAHMVVAVQSVLSREPRHGRAALEELRNAILRPSFPRDPARIEAFLDSSYLGRARSFLIDQTLAVLIKSLLLRTDPDLEPYQKVLATITGILLKRHPASAETKVRDILPRVLASADDQAIWRLYWLIAEDARFFDWAGEAARIRLVELTGKWKFKAVIPPFRIAVKHPELRGAAKAAFDSVDRDVQFHLFEACPEPMFFDSAIEAFGESSSFRTAEARAAVLLPILAANPELKASQIIAVLDAATENRQIWDAALMPELLSGFFSETARFHQETAENWRDFLGGQQSSDSTRRRHWRYGQLLASMIQAGVWTEENSANAAREDESLND